MVAAEETAADAAGRDNQACGFDETVHDAPDLLGAH
jgi:hypothetical protein